ncbi:TetR/AcrR family transcriptional regulator [Kitasatospora sp. NPDC090091]|uniref:TetR/AcrR family transcriptional regulator n=1 Tax=Kitasatospora sp. NPDC090091 TaxID=3364081 RepID=UPI003820C50E
MRQPSDEAAPAAPRRERKKERTREHVYAAAVALFSRQGYADTSVTQIAEQAGIGRGTFFNYFPHKDCLINIWTQERVRKLHRRLAPRLRNAPDTAGALRACMSTLSDLNEEEPELSAAMLTAWIQTGRLLQPGPPLGAILTDIVEQGRTRGEIHTTASAEQIAGALRDLYIGALHRWSHPAADRAHGRLDTELQQALNLLLHGLTPHHPPPRPRPGARAGAGADTCTAGSR